MHVNAVKEAIYTDKESCSSNQRVCYLFSAKAILSQNISNEWLVEYKM